MNERLCTLRKLLNKSQEALASDIGLTKNYLSLVETGKRNLSDNSIKVLCSLYDVNEDWLRYGTGEIFINRSLDEEIAEFMADVQIGDDKFKKQLITTLARLKPEQWSLLQEIADNIVNGNLPKK